MSKRKFIAAMALTGFSVLSSDIQAEDTSIDDNISGTLTLHNFEERVSSGDIKFKPLSEMNLTVAWDKLSAEFTGDFETDDPLGYDEVRLERARLTYAPDDQTSLTAGYLGEHRFFEGLFGSAGGRPDVTLGETLYALRIDNPELVGLIATKDFNFQNGTDLSLEGSVFGVTDQNNNPSSLAEDRANSENLSFAAKARITDNALSYGLEGGTTRHGVLGNADEHYIGLFAQHKIPLNENGNVVLTSTGEVLNFENFNNQDDENSTLGVAYTNIQWTPKEIKNLTLWSQIGAVVDSQDPDKLVGEIGARYDFVNDGKLRASGFVAADLERTLGSDENTEYGTQVGVTMKYEFE